MAGVRAKFRCVKVSEELGWGTRADGTTGEVPSKSVRLVPVMGGSAENEAFFRYIPSGAIDLGILNVRAAEAFVIGKEYYVDFTAVEPSP
jgi:hypothetical protein